MRQHCIRRRKTNDSSSYDRNLDFLSYAAHSTLHMLRLNELVASIVPRRLSGRPDTDLPPRPRGAPFRNAVGFLVAAEVFIDLVSGARAERPHRGATAARSAELTHGSRLAGRDYLAPGPAPHGTPVVRVRSAAERLHRGARSLPTT